MIRQVTPIKKRLESILSKLTPHGPITARAMFGGYGIYFDKKIFSILIGEQLFFRVDQSNIQDYEHYKCKPFVYEGKNKPVALPYMTLPEEILNNPKELPKWIEKSLHTSLKNRSSKRKSAARLKN